MLHLLVVFSFYVALAGVSLLIFWALQIRYGQVEDLDPTSFLVRWLSPKVISVQMRPVPSSTTSGSSGPSWWGARTGLGTAAVLVMYAMILDGQTYQPVLRTVENEPLPSFCFVSMNAVLSLPQDADLR